MQTIHSPQEFAAAFGVPPETIARLVIYERLLRQWQKAVNLVSPATLDAVWHRHFADSAQLVALAPPAIRSWIDLGSGAGFPGLVAAIMMAGPPYAASSPPEAPSSSPAPSRRPSPGAPQPPTGRGEGWGEGQPHPPTPTGRGRDDGLPPPANGKSGPGAGPGRPSVRFTLIESDARKCAFLREVARQTGIPVDILSKRAESARTSVNEDLPRVVSARALAPLARLFELAEPFSPPGTTLLFPKGKEVGRELQEAQSRWQFQVALVPSITDEHGRIAVITNLERKAKD